MRVYHKRTFRRKTILRAHSIAGNLWCSQSLLKTKMLTSASTCTFCNELFPHHHSPLPLTNREAFTAQYIIACLTLQAMSDSSLISGVILASKLDGIEPYTRCTRSGVPKPPCSIDSGRRSKLSLDNCDLLKWQTMQFTRRPCYSLVSNQGPEPTHAPSVEKPCWARHLRMYWWLCATRDNPRSS
jgi:hypothetical protein